MVDLAVYEVLGTQDLTRLTMTLGKALTADA